MTRDKHVDIMLAIGILFVVMGHSYQLKWLYFPAYTFHMAFFFFISGYLFRIKISWKEKVLFYRKKIINQLVPYFVFNAVFFCIAYYLKTKGINFIPNLNLKTFFVEPFISGHQNFLIIPMWFLLNLFIVNIIAQTIYINDNKSTKIIYSIIILGLTYYALTKGLNLYTDYRLLLIRTCFAFFFFQLGILIKQYKSKVDNILINPLLIIILFAVVNILTNLSGNINYSIVWGSVENEKIYVPLLSTTIIVLISYSVSYYVSSFTTDKNVILLLGRKSFWIMSLHLFIFFLVNLCFYKLGYINKTDLNQIYFHYEAERYFYYYLFPGIVLPIWLGLLFDKVKNKITTR